MAYPVPLRRILSGALAGLLAGLALHVVMVAGGALGPIAAASGLDSTEAVAAAQVLSSAVLGLAFAALPVTGGWPRALAWGLGYGAAVWAVVDLVLVRAALGRAVALTPAALMGLAGRLAWGAALGLAFVFLMVWMFRASEARKAQRPSLP